MFFGTVLVQLVQASSGSGRFLLKTCMMLPSDVSGHNAMHAMRLTGDSVTCVPTCCLSRNTAAVTWFRPCLNTSHNQSWPQVTRPWQELDQGEMRLQIHNPSHDRPLCVRCCFMCSMHNMSVSQPRI